MKIGIIIDRGKRERTKFFCNGLFIGSMTRPIVEYIPFVHYKQKYQQLGKTFTIVWISDSHKDCGSRTNMKRGSKQSLFLCIRSLSKLCTSFYSKS